jgi:hypothetical protein
MDDLKAKILAVLDQNQKNFRPSPKDDERGPEFERLRDLLDEIALNSFPGNYASNVDEAIANKIAITETQGRRILSDDWWWTPSSSWRLTSVLRELRIVTQKARGAGGWRWLRGIEYAWTVVRQLIYLGIVLGLFFVASCVFENLVFAALVLIYNSVVSVGSILGLFVEAPDLLQTSCCGRVGDV